MRAVIAIGSEDTSGTNSAGNLTSIIENLKGQGYTEFAVVPPNVQVNASRFNEISAAAQTAGAQIVNGVFGTDDPTRLTPTSAATIAPHCNQAATRVNVCADSTSQRATSVALVRRAPTVVVDRSECCTTRTAMSNSKLTRTVHGG